MEILKDFLMVIQMTKVTNLEIEKEIQMGFLNLKGINWDFQMGFQMVIG